MLHVNYFFEVHEMLQISCDMAWPVMIDTYRQIMHHIGMAANPFQPLVIRRLSDPIHNDLEKYMSFWQKNMIKIADDCIPRVSEVFGQWNQLVDCLKNKALSLMTVVSDPDWPSLGIQEYVDIPAAKLCRIYEPQHKVERNICIVMGSLDSCDYSFE
eukprot:TRINITY_DN4979_c0_g1_i8.p1 TRINITY_DN4979_c0_g1~~TRINITY_DN4979_c0_g1_i8.p1  ORF type:complete len:157 (-),score=10.68 TRINITY_DN4979_c0_g1_i8:49-519(-)